MAIASKEGVPQSDKCIVHANAVHALHTMLCHVLQDTLPVQSMSQSVKHTLPAILALTRILTLIVSQNPASHPIREGAEYLTSVL